MTAALGVGIGLWVRWNRVEVERLVPMFALLPSVAYLVLRTRGRERLASGSLAVVYILTVVLRIFEIDLDVGALFGRPTVYLMPLPYTVPLADIKPVGMGLVIVLSLMLVLRARDVYARWAAAIITVTSLPIVYLLATLAIVSRLERWF